MQCFTFYRCVSCLLCDSSPVSGAAKLCFITKKKKLTLLVILLKMNPILNKL